MDARTRAWPPLVTRFAKSIRARNWKASPYLSRPDAADTVCQRFADIDILINNLGTYEVKPFEEISDSDWQAIIETNFMSGVRLSRFYLPRMKAAGWGRIVFISSESAVNIPVEMIHYGVTKTMQLALSRGWRRPPRAPA